MMREAAHAEPIAERRVMIVVAYASKHGSTEGIARHIAARLLDRGTPSEARPAASITDLEQADAVVLGSAVYAGSWMKETTEFVDRHERALTELPVWLFSSGPLGDEIAEGL
jgi:menaquinone-dependent protoporphyrinogen oxidase